MEAVGLGDGRVHHHRSGEAGGPCEHQLQAQELLEPRAAGRGGPRVGAPGVHHQRPFDPAAVGEAHLVLPHFDNLGPRDEPRGRSRQALAHHLIHADGRNGRVAVGERSREVREADVAGGPAVGNQGIQPSARRRLDVTLVEGPGVVPSQTGLALDEGDGRAGPAIAEGEGEERVLESTAHEHVVERHGLPPDPSKPVESWALPTSLLSAGGRGGAIVADSLGAPRDGPPARLSWSGRRGPRPRSTPLPPPRGSRKEAPSPRARIPAREPLQSRGSPTWRGSRCWPRASTKA